VKQLQADWASGPVWKMPFPAVGADGAPVPLTVSRAASFDRGESWAHGTLTHDLPGTLKEWTIVVVPRQRPLDAGNRGDLGTAMITQARAFRQQGSAGWAPGEVLDLGVVTRVTSRTDDSTAERIFKDLRGRGLVDDANAYQGPGQNQPKAADALARLAGVAFFSQLEPADKDESGLGRGGVVARRRLTHGWDLGAWFTHPCIIIVGTLGDKDHPAPSPVPISVDGRALETEGVTIVRWVYPAADDPPALERSAEESKDKSGEAGTPAPVGPG
jgi:hypothetical protein